MNVVTVNVMCRTVRPWITHLDTQYSIYYIIDNPRPLNMHGCSLAAHNSGNTCPMTTRLFPTLSIQKMSKVQQQKIMTAFTL